MNAEYSRTQSEATFHIHAHVIIDMERKLTRTEWSNLLKGVRSWWQFHFKEAKRIHGAREACKYVVKPGELETLTAPELAALHHELFRLHLVQCLGGAQRAAEEAGEFPRQGGTPGG